MDKIAYLVASDLHQKYCNFQNRFDYRDEVRSVQMQLIKIAKKYASAGYKVKLLLLGDVFHNSYKDIFNAINDNNFFYVWKDFFGEIYSVVGNHELTYYKSNPFYTLVSEIHSKKISGLLNKVWTPVGVSDVIRVVDELHDGDVHFYFNHYDTNVSIPESTGINIGLFHQDIVCNQIITQMKNLYGAEYYGTTVDFNKCEFFEKYDICFFGHMHQVYGIWRTGGCTLYYLASLGRTNIAEVNDNFLERNVPAVIIEDGKFKTVEDNKFYLASRKDCVKEEIVALNKETYNLKKDIQEIKDHVPAFAEPVKNLKVLFSEDASISLILSDLLQFEQDSITNEIIRETGVLLNENIRN